MVQVEPERHISASQLLRLEYGILGLFLLLRNPLLPLDGFLHPTWEGRHISASFFPMIRLWVVGNGYTKSRYISRGWGAWSRLYPLFMPSRCDIGLNSKSLLYPSRHGWRYHQRSVHTYHIISSLGSLFLRVIVDVLCCAVCASTARQWRHGTEGAQLRSHI